MQLPLTLTFQENASMSIYPTVLYVKRHKKTDLKYFGKTTRKNLESYNGSGKYWKRHLNQHGEDVETIWASEEFHDAEDLTDFALLFSELFDIVNSDQWANLVPENGIDGAPRGYPKPEGFGQNFIGDKNSMYGKPNPFKGKSHSEEQKKIWREMKLGEKNPNYGGKSFTEDTLKKLRKPKSNKENYKGSPGKITCIDNDGNAVQISVDEYNSQKELNIPTEQWKYVATRSKEAIRRKQNNDPNY